VWTEGAFDDPAGEATAIEAFELARHAIVSTRHLGGGA